MTSAQMQKAKRGDLWYRLIPNPEGAALPWFIQEYRVVGRTVTPTRQGAEPVIHLSKFADMLLPIKVRATEMNSYYATPGEACAALLFSKQRALEAAQYDLAAADRAHRLAGELLKEFQAGKATIVKAPEVQLVGRKP